jgi:hypothetical protein
MKTNDPATRARRHPDAGERAVMSRGVFAALRSAACAAAPAARLRAERIEGSCGGHGAGLMQVLYGDDERTGSQGSKGQVHGQRV